MSTMQVTCPRCRKSFRIPKKFAGRDGECSACRAVFHIPGQAKTADTPDEIVQPHHDPGFHSSATEEIPVHHQSFRTADEEFSDPVIDISLSGESFPLADSVSQAIPVPIDESSESLPIAIPLSDDEIDTETPLADAVDAAEPLTDVSTIESIESTRSRPDVRPRRLPDPSKSIRRKVEEIDEDHVLNQDDVPQRDRPTRTPTGTAIADKGETDNRHEDDSKSSETRLGRRGRHSDQRSRRTGNNAQQRPGRSPKQTAIVVGCGILLLLIAGLYSRFTSRTSPVSMPTLETSPATADTGRPNRSLPPDSTPEPVSTPSVDAENDSPPPSRVSGGGF